MLELREVAAFCILALCTILSVYIPFGPTTGARDHFDNTISIAESWQRQMLLSIVKIRSDGAPIFFEVASIINQYQPQTDINSPFSWTFPAAPLPGRKHLQASGRREASPQPNDNR